MKFDQATARSNQPNDESLKYLLAFCESSSAGFILCDRDLRLTFANEQVVQTIGAKNLDELVGLTLDQLVSPPPPPDHIAKYREVIETGKSAAFDVLPVHSDSLQLFHRFHAFKVGEGIGFVVYDITAETLAKRANEESRRILRETGRMAQIGGWEYDLRTGKSIWTESLYKIMACPEDKEPPGPDEFRQYLSDEDTALIKLAHDKAVNFGESFDLELQLIRADGQRRWFRSYGEPVFHQGQCIKLRGTLQDIHVHKTAAEQAQQHEERYRYLFDNAQVLIAVFDPDGVCIMMNRKAARFFGKKPEEMVGAHFDRLHPENAARFKTLRQAILDGGGPIESEVETTFPVGRRWLLSRMNAMHDANGAIIAVQMISHDITARKKAEKARVESYRMFRSVFENAAIGIALAGLEGRWLDVNQRLCDIVGYSRDEMLNMSFRDITHPEDIPDKLDRIDLLMNGEIDNFVVQKRYIRKDNSVAWVNLTVSIIRNEQNKPEKFVVAVEDITERKKSEIELARAHEALAVAQKMARIGYWSFDIATQTGSWSPQMFEVLDLNPSDGIPQYVGLHQFIHPDDRKAFSKAMYSCTIGKPYNMVIRIVHTDGSIHWINTQGFPKQNDNGEIVDVFGIVQDITHLKRAESALLESEEKYRSLIESIDLGISMISPDFEVMSVNRKMTDWYPDASTLIGHKCYEVFNDPHRDTPCEYCAVIKALQDGQVHETVSNTPTADGIRNYRLVASPVCNEAGEVISVIETVEDVTESRRLEVEIQKQAKLESIGVLAGGIAHDFNNILTAITGNLSLARLDCELDSPVDIAIEQAMRASERAQSITGQLLTFAKGGAPVRQTSNLDTVLRESAIFSLHGSNTICDFEIPSDLRLVDIDVGQISQVINNLVINASQAMPDGGIIRITASNYDHIGSGSGLPLKAVRYIRVSVSDSGIGIQDKHLKKVFDPFFTTKEKGSGLGLASCYSIIRRHDGHIEVESSPGQGTTFTFFLPASEKSEITPVEPNNVNPPGHGRILVVDDEAAIRDITTRILTQHGYESAAVENGHEAVDLYEREHTQGHPFDAVILDLTIPGSIGGCDILEALRQINPDVKAVVSSGYSTDPIMSNYREYGFSARLGKPFRAADLAGVLHRLLR
ncbi:MAG TPA: PAS domain S-box protein [candidate division Zixibacteria bacterium]|nr:PAS domain S-box protein [candidate division Zixibacteria bacterium]